MAHYGGFIPRGTKSRRQRLASWLVLALTALVGATVPSRAGAAIAPAAMSMAASSKASTVAPTVPEVAALRAATRVTPATQSVAAVSQHVAVDSAFQAYYSANAGAQLLGAPLTPAFLTKDGLAQFFADGELVLPLPHAAQTSLGDDTQQAPGAIAWHPLFDDLLQLGSTAPVGGDTSTLTYLDLRRAVLASPLVNGTTLQSTLASGAFNARDDADQGSVFIASSESDGQTFGHFVPAAIWSYIQRADVSPQGWHTAFGAPLTEALPLLATVGGTLHRELVQVFTNGAVLVDETAEPAGNGESAYRLPTGLAYLETTGLPAVLARKGTPFWAAHDAAILQNPASGAAEAHIGQNFPLTLAGTSAWVDGALWYGVNWQTPGRSGSGWLAATDATFAEPDPGSPPTASFDLLSTDLQQYLQQYGTRVGAYVYDLTRNAAYSYNSSGLFTIASSIKVPILLTFLAMTERQGREPNDGEMELLTTMIENSDNGSAQALWDEVGGPAVASYLQSTGVSDFHPDYADGWGWSTISPRSMVQLLALLHNGQVLTAQDRQLALYLMNNVEADEQTGVGDTAPPGATVEMKDGWVTGPDGLWVMNTTGIVTLGGETYIISVYTDDDDSLQQGWDITRHVCQVVGQLLT